MFKKNIPLKKEFSNTPTESGEQSIQFEQEFTSENSIIYGGVRLWWTGEAYDKTPICLRCNGGMIQSVPGRTPFVCHKCRICSDFVVIPHDLPPPIKVG